MPSTNQSPLSLSIPPTLPHATHQTTSPISDSSDTESIFSANTTPATSPAPEESLITAYAIKQKPSKPSTNTSNTIDLFKTLEEANDTVYKLRLDYETCDPCFFWYGDGHGYTSLSETERAPGEDVEANQKGDCLSWEVFADEEEEGCRVWVERVVVAAESVKCGGDGLKRGNWREALEPIARPCHFWGTFTVKS